MGFKSAFYRYMMMAAVLPAAAIVVSCGNKLKKIDADKISEAPTQVVLDMDAAQTENGDKDNSREEFSDGFQVLAYNEEGLLETRIVSDEALHTMSDGKEQWSAYGNVVINNYIKGERIETDTLYWDREEKIIFTDCYVRLSSPQGFMQGYGLESDEMARDAQLLRPFDSYGILSDDSTGSGYVDTVNFIGPNVRR